MTPWQRYQQDLKRVGFSRDPAQEEAVACLEALYHELMKRPPRPRGSWLGGLLGKDRATPRKPVRGLYLWGGVGRGKTYLIDAFYSTLPLREKLRMHFHRFMQHVHRELSTLKDEIDPLSIVADRLAARARVICFDEFHVADITDAMLLGGLLQALFERGVTLVATSNQHPDILYADGLQRQRFLPAIELIKAHTRVVNVDSGVDYRLRNLEQAEIYHHPLDDSAHASLEASFARLAPESGVAGRPIEVEGRLIPALRLADGVVWFEFEAICGGPRGPADYIEIARCFQTVLISDVPVMRAADDDKARRLMTLIDEFYDHNVKLIVSAAAEPDALYAGQRLREPFMRTISRLQEMRSQEYLARPHLP